MASQTSAHCDDDECMTSVLTLTQRSEDLASPPHAWQSIPSLSSSTAGSSVDCTDHDTVATASTVLVSSQRSDVNPLSQVELVRQDAVAGTGDVGEPSTQSPWYEDELVLQAICRPEFDNMCKSFT